MGNCTSTSTGEICPKDVPAIVFAVSSAILAILGLFWTIQSAFSNWRLQIVKANGSIGLTYDKRPNDLNNKNYVHRSITLHNIGESCTIGRVILAPNQKTAMRESRIPWSLKRYDITNWTLVDALKRVYNDPEHIFDNFEAVTEKSLFGMKAGGSTCIFKALFDEISEDPPQNGANSSEEQVQASTQIAPESHNTSPRSPNSTSAFEEEQALLEDAIDYGILSIFDEFCERYVLEIEYSAFRYSNGRVDREWLTITLPLNGENPKGDLRTHQPEQISDYHEHQTRKLRCCCGNGRLSDENPKGEPHTHQPEQISEYPKHEHHTRKLHFCCGNGRLFFCRNCCAHA